MTRHLTAFVSLFALTGSLLAVDVAPSPRPVYRPVSVLAPLLGSPDWVERDAASVELEKIGPAALPALRTVVENTTDGEVLRRGRLLITRLEKRLADEKALAPTMVELNGKFSSIQEAVAELSKQSGYTVTFTSSSHREYKRVILNTGKVVFWDAIEQLCDAADLQIAAVGPFSAPRTKIVGTPTIQTNTVSDVEIQPLAPPVPKANPTAAIEQLKKDLEKIAQSRKEVAKEVNATAKAREAELEKIQAEAQARLKDLERQLAVQKAIGDQVAVPGPGKPAAAPLPLPAPGAIGQQIQAIQPAKGPPPPPTLAGPSTAIVLEPRVGAKRPSANFGAVRLEAMAMPDGAAVQDAVAVLVQVWAEPKLQWQQTRSIRVRQARDDNDQALAANMIDALASGPLVIDGNGIQMIQNVNGGVIINNGGGRVVINGNVQGQIIVNNGQVIIQGGNVTTGTQTLPTPSFAPNARQSVVKLQPGEKSSDLLKDFAGVLEAIVKTAPEALVTIADLSKASEQTHVSGVRLKTSEIAKGSNDTYTLHVELEHTQAVQPAAPSGESNVPLAGAGPFRAGFVVRGGAVVRHPGSMDAGRVFSGLRVADEAGTPFELSLTQPPQIMATGTTNSLKLVLQLGPTAKGQSAPKSITFWGTRSASVDVPFSMKDVPALAAKK